MRVDQEICLGHFKDSRLLRIKQIGVETDLDLIAMFETRESITQMMDTEVTPRARKVCPYVNMHEVSPRG
ncbi:hypothetical protein HMPREF9061_01450 [Actinomyces sp. oral taxon 181 str. F0379]|nr:hypothetical protein HMPREF9061_01450 [Actinomyces sp. oral taxon 181 str. F0379]